MERAVIPLAASPALRSFLLEREMLIDETSVDEVLPAALTRTPRSTHAVGGILPAFHPGEQGRNHRPANPVQPAVCQSHLDFALLRDAGRALNQRLSQGRSAADDRGTVAGLPAVGKGPRPRGARTQVLADLVSLVRHAALDEDLLPYPERVERRYQEWLSAAHGRQFTRSNDGGWMKLPARSASTSRSAWKT